MFKLARGLIIAGILGLSFCSPGIHSASAQNPYWNNHWRWYDNTYRPYYQRYYYGPSYYGPSYYGTSPGYYYSAPSGYYNNYYYGPGYVQPYAGVRVGPMSFGWW